jgi:hypothetical protein
VKRNKRVRLAAEDRLWIGIAPSMLRPAAATAADRLARRPWTCEHMFVSSSSADAFVDRLLDLVPVYYEAGRAIAGLPRDGLRRTAADLADAACRRWLLPAIPADAEAIRVVAAELADSTSPLALVDFAYDVERLAAALGDAPLAATARHAAATARAAAEGRDADAGRAAADCLYSRRAAGTAFLVAEARAVTSAARLFEP